MKKNLFLNNSVDIQKDKDYLLGWKLDADCGTFCTDV